MYITLKHDQAEGLDGDFKVNGNTNILKPISAV